MDLQLLAHFFTPYRAQAKAQLCAQLLPKCQHYQEDAFYANIENDLLASLFSHSHIVLLSLYDRISGEVTFEEFALSLQQNSVHQYVSHSYQQLDSNLARITLNWANQLANILNAFQTDKAAIAERFFPNSPGLDISHIQFSSGDKHNGGQAVAILLLNNGKKLVFKPRNLTIDSRIQTIYNWINNHTEFALQLPQVLVGEDHGWVEFIGYQACESRHEIEFYYQRLGAITAIVYLLGGTDIHYENIIAHGAQPILIDLETFFHPAMPDGGLDSIEIVDDTVLRTGILPTTIIHNPNFEMPTISGVTDVEGTSGIFENDYLERKDDGSFHFVRKKGELSGASNVPFYGGEKYPLKERFITDMTAGFVAVSRLVLAKRNEFIGIVEQFEDVNIRIIVRNTACYSYLLSSSNHPDVLKTAQSWRDHFSLIHAAIKDFKSSAPLVDYELQSLQSLDVPYFLCRAGGRDLHNGLGQSYANFFPKSGFALVKQELEVLTEHHLNYQAWLIEKTLAIDSTEVSIRQRALLPLDTALDLARHHTNKLEANLFQDADTTAWLVMTSNSLDNSSSAVINASYDLYCGVAGEALLFAAVEKLTRTPSPLLIKIANAFETKVSQHWQAIASLGAYIGWGGVFKTYLLLSQLTGQSHYLDRIGAWLEQIDFESLIRNDRNKNFIKGAAGFMQVCSEVFQQTNNSKALELAQMCADKLLNEATSTAQGLGWQLFSAKPLSGMAHGSSGFAMGFASLYAITEQQRYKDAALACVDYETSLYCAEQQNWLDIRDIIPADEKYCSVAWSHGAAGIGLARLHLLKCGIADSQIQLDLERAVATTLELGFQANDSVIYGDFGNLELLIQYDDYAGKAKEIAVHLDNIKAEMLARLTATIDTDQFEQKQFGLMSGYTGCIYQLLRAKYRDEIPSFLAS